MEVKTVVSSVKIRKLFVQESEESPMEKAKVYSTEFRELYNIDKITNMSDELAQQIYKNFLKAKKENEEV